MAGQKKEGTPEKPYEKQRDPLKQGDQGGRGDLPGQGSPYQDRGTGGAPGNRNERPGTGVEEEDEESERNRDRSRATEPKQGDRSA